MNAAPWTFADALRESQEAESRQERAENRLAESYKTAAAAERAYKEALAKKILDLKAAGVAWTVCGDLARGDKKVAELREIRDIALGAREAAGVATWRHQRNRKDVAAFAVWSKQRELAEGYGQGPDPAWDARTGEVVTHPKAVA